MDASEWCQSVVVQFFTAKNVNVLVKSIDECKMRHLYSDDVRIFVVEESHVLLTKY